MVCLNENISFRKIKLRDNLIKKVTEKVNNNFYLDKLNNLKIESKIKSDLTISIINNVNIIIKNEIKDLFESDHFIYINMDNNICSHKFNKGKKDGYYCCKKITKNGNRNKYVCTKHNPDHIPKKRAKNAKKEKNYNDEIINTILGDNKIILCKKTNKKIFKNRFKNKYKFKNKIKIHGEINFKYIMEKLLA